MIAFATLLAGTLFLMLATIALNGWLASRSAPAAGSAGQPAPVPFPSEFLPNVFSVHDWDFVRELNNLALKKLFIRERKHVALAWVAETSAALTLVMRRHAQAARHSSNLNPVTELKILAHYLSLLVLCGALALSIRMVGPVRLGGLAQLAHAMTLRLAEVHRSVQAGVQSPDALAGIRN